ncbi:TolC family protein [Pedobacter sp. SD-b]|uniref:TolC family protein n=1 Tax=Pedobacter segetis TaxID=2793069 RepID=A0ABS1BLA5_9SPHI|nr:TolC family protein [Pedobacter segetis]MBK0383669.1 TolC family protein [Pedobacter segetis]
MLLIVLAFVVFTPKVKAQQSMVQDVNYLFLEKLLATARQNYPIVKQYEIQKNIDNLNIKGQKLNWFSPLNFSYLSSPNNTINFVDPRFFTGYQFGVNINVADILQKPNKIKIAKQQLLLTEANESQYAQTLEIEVKKRYFLYIQELNTVKLFSKSVQDAEGLLNDLRVKYERGEVEFRVYSEALVNFSSISKQKLEAEANYLTAKASIEELTITKLEDIK